MQRRALITGITGQDGLYLGELLAAKGYEVFGMVRGQSNPKIELVEQHIPSVQLVEGDLRDLPSLISALEIAEPHEVYNLGAISFVGLSWKQAELTGEITGMGVLRILEAIRIQTQGHMDKIKFYQASSSEMFGKVRETPQTEKTPFHPALAVRGGQDLRPLHDPELPRVLRRLRLLRDPVQPRVADARHRVRHP